MESIKVIIVSTWNIPCGIATYTEDIIRNGTSEVDYEVFQISKSDWAFATKGKLEEIYKDFEHSIADRDIVYFQHEHGIWGAERGHKFALKNFLNFFKIALKRQKKIVISLHTDFSESRINKNKLFYQFKRWKNLRRIKYLINFFSSIFVK